MKSVLWVCLAGALIAGALSAQDITGSINGAVLDPSGAAVPNAKVTITNTDRNQVIRTITTGPDGTYSATFLPVGTYAIKVEAPGFRTAARSNIPLNVNDVKTINVSLEVGAATEQVTVQEAPVAVELGTAANSSLMEGTTVRELQLSTRNYEQLVSLMPGVSTDNVDQLYIGSTAPSGLANTIPFSINGQRNSANNWTVDGADNVDRGANLTLLNYPSVDAISEFKVQRSLYTADSGRAGGAQIQVVTRSGGSQFHGDAYEFFRNDAIVAN
ncbi:MAG TPA: carboxypeptidase-like regulatory domain-containing protein, partial [Bryobacteraceae bacterium]